MDVYVGIELDGDGRIETVRVFVDKAGAEEFERVMLRRMLAEQTEAGTVGGDLEELREAASNAGFAWPFYLERVEVMDG